jgi:hypothetical protein
MITFIRGKYGAGLRKVCRLLKNRGIGCCVARKEDINPAYYAHWEYTSRMVVNWGVTDYHSSQVDFELMFNPPEILKGVVNKLEFFKEYTDWFPTVPWTESKFIAETWRKNNIEFYARTKLSSSGGKGIVFYPQGSEEDVVDAPLYTQRIRGREYRVHVDLYSGKIIDVAQKRKMTTEKLEAVGFSYNKYIKSFKNGWVHSHIDIVPLPDGLEEKILQDFEGFPLDFFAIDLIIPRDYPWNMTSSYYVLEVNTAPGLINTETIKAYADMFERYYQEVS